MTIDPTDAPPPQPGPRPRRETIPVIVRLTPEQLAAVDLVAALRGSSVPGVLEEHAEGLLAGARRLARDMCR